MKLLLEKNAVITGARRGIGRAAVKVFAENGCNIWACAKNRDTSFEEEMLSISKRYGVDIWPMYFDVKDEIQIKKAIQGMRKSKRSVDILVNNAGIASEGSSFQMTSMDRMDEVFAVNFFGVTRLTQYVSRLMARQKSGCIVNLASIAGIDGIPAQYEYAASKAAIIGGTKKLAYELASYNIRVNAVAPGMVETDMGEQIDESLKKEILHKVIMKRMGRPEEIANAIIFLASDLSSYMTGQVIRVDGGM